METLLTQDELKAILSAVHQFARGSIAPLVERHEVIISPSQIKQTVREAEKIGLLNFSVESGLGLWENLDDTAGVRLSMEALTRLAEENAGIAWHFHQLAFGRWLTLSLGLNAVLGQGVVLANIQGYYGLGRTALPRYLRGADLTDDDQVLLADYFTPAANETPIILHQLDGWQWLLTPFFQNGQINWSLLPREKITCEEHPHSHGLNELTSIACKPYINSEMRTNLGGEMSRAVYAEAIQISALALMSIALGTVRKTYRIAGDYAAVRIQGGTTINRLPAVQQMLAGIRSAITTSESLLENLSKQPLKLENTARLLSVRSHIQPMLSLAANDAVQIMGGIGYMRDTGVEKVLRDTNQLRLMHGTPAELALFTAEWERLS